MFKYFYSLFTPTPVTEPDWNNLSFKEIKSEVNNLLDMEEYELIFKIPQNKLPVDAETQVRFAKEVPGWNIERNLFSSVGPLEVIMACLESSDGEEWISSLPEKSIYKQCQHTEFAIRAFELYPDYMIKVPLIMFHLDPVVFDTDGFEQALESHPDVVFDIDEENSTFLESYKFWTVSAMKRIVSVIGSNSFQHLVRISPVEYRLETDVKKYLDKFRMEERRVTRSMTKN